MEQANYKGFAEVARRLRAEGLDAVKIGETISTRHDDYGTIIWDIIGDHPNEGTITAFMRNPPEWRCFDTPCKEWPFGLGIWDTSDIRRMLQSRAFLDGFDPDDEAAVLEVTKRTYDPRNKKYIETKDKFFLLSASEMGFPLKPGIVLDEGIPYMAFAGTGSEPRRKRDIDGDDCFYWLRSPYPSLAYYVRLVYPSGALGNSDAYGGGGLAAACDIGPSDHPRR